MYKYISDIFGNESFEVDSLDEFINILNGPPPLTDSDGKPMEFSEVDFHQIGDDFYYNGEKVLEAI